MKAVSYSGLGMYGYCPRAFEEKYVKETVITWGRPMTEADAPAMFRGKRIHEGIEKFLLKQSDELPKEVQENYAGFFGMLREEAMLRVELPWAFDKDWGPVDFDSEDCSLRGVIDSLLYDIDENIIHLYEYKTGKAYGDHAEQLQLYSMAALLAFPAADAVYADTIYLDHHKNVPQTFERDLMPSYKWLWDRRIKRVQPPQKYPMRPSWRCKNCAYNAQNGGGCHPPQKGD